MKYSYTFGSLIILSLAFFVSGCSTRPTELIQQTEEARQQAKDEYADQFALNDWNEAEKAWDQAAAKLETEDYGEAYTLLLKAKTRYEKAREIAAGQRAQATKEIESLQRTANLRLQALKESMAGKRLSSSKRKELDETVGAIEQKISQVGTELDQGQYSEAKLTAQKTIRQIWETEQEVK